MACLGDLIRSSLRSGSKAKITTLHRYIFESEGDRSNRQRLRAFCGFAYNEGSAEFEVKSRYVDANLSERDLVTICNVLGIDYNVADVKLHIFHNLQKGRLLVASGAENHDDDDDDGVGSEDEAANSYDGAEQRACSTLRNRRNDDCFFSIDGNEGRKEAHKTAERRERRRICDEREASISASEVNENEMPMQMSRFAINFRDIEGSVRPFDGTDKLPIDVWVNEFEETATLMRWDEFQKFVFAKKSLKGLARMFILSERGITSWCKLKKALIDEFQAVVNSAHLHKQLTERKMKREENVQEYFFCMKELAARGNIEENALIQYVIDGIRDMSVSKTVLYGAKNIREFKEKLRCYEGIREKVKTDDTKEIGKKGMVNKTERNELKCYNCGAKGHKSVNCESREKGTKCFQCNEYGHIAKNCTNNKSLNKGAQRNIRLITGKRSIMNKDVIMNDKKLIALFDTGSKFSLITESVYNVLNKPYLKECNISLYGFGECDTKNAVKPMGTLKYKIEIDGEIYELEFLVVPSKFLDCEVIIGENFCAYAEVKLDREGLHIKKVEHDSDDNSKFFMMKIDIAADEKEIDIGEMAQIGSKQKILEHLSNTQKLEERVTELRQKLDQAQQKNDVILLENKRLQRELNEERDRSDTASDATSQAQIALQNLQDNYERLKYACTITDNQLTEVESMLESEQKRNKVYQEKLDNVNVALRKKEDTIAQLRKEVSDEQNQKSASESRVQALSAEIKEISGNLVETQKKLISHQQQLTEQTNHLFQSQERVEVLANETSNLQAINSTYTRSTKTTPFELMIGVKMRKKEDIQLKQLIEDEMILHFQDERNELRQNAKREILKLQAENRKSYNRKRKPASLYNRGDLVAIKRTQFGVGLKLKPKYLGPYEVRSIKSNGTYDVLKIGLGDGPKTTTTCAEYMKPWSISSDDDSIAFGPNAQQDGRVVGMVDNNGERGTCVSTGVEGGSSIKFMNSSNQIYKLTL